MKNLKEMLNESISNDKNIIDGFCSNNKNEQIFAIEEFKKLLTNHNALRYDWKNRDDIEPYMNRDEFKCFIQFNDDDKGCPFIMGTKISRKYHISYIKKLGDNPIYHKPNFWDATMRYFGYGDIYIIPKELEDICDKSIRNIYLKY